MQIYSKEVTGFTAKDSQKQSSFISPAKYEYVEPKIFPSQPNARCSLEDCHSPPPAGGKMQYSLKQLKLAARKPPLICSETPNRFAESQLLQNNIRPIGRLTYSKSPPQVVRHVDDYRYGHLKDQRMELTEDSFRQDGGSAITITCTPRDKDNKFVRKNSQKTFMRSKLYRDVFDKMKRCEEECVYLRSKFLDHMNDNHRESRLHFQSPQQKLP